MTLRSIIALLLLSLPHSRVEAESTALQTQKDLHHATLAEYEASWELKSAQLARAYLADLVRLRDSANGTGHSEATLAAYKERKRFEQSNGFAAAPPPDTPEWIQRVRHPFAQRAAKLDAVYRLKVGAQNELYLDVLEGLKKRLIEQQRPNEAIEVAREQNRVRDEGPDPDAPLPDAPAPLTPTVTHELGRDLELYYQFNPNKLDPIHDASEKERHGKALECRWSDQGVEGGCLEFQSHRKPRVVIHARGTGGDVYRSPNLDQGFTVSLYVRIANDAANRKMVLISNQERSGFGLVVNRDRHLNFHVYCGDQYFEAIYAVPFKPATWYHLTGVMQPHSIQLFLNGRPVAATRIPLSAKPRPGRVRLLIGANPGGKWRSSDHFNGHIDELAVWKRALSPGEIRLLHSMHRLN